MRASQLMIGVFTVCVASCTVGSGEVVGSDAGAGRPDSAVMDAGGANGVDAGRADAGPPGDASSVYRDDADPEACMDAVPDGCSTSEVCDDGLDDDCDGRVDEGCACTTGTVQDCFVGPPGRRGVGACQTGTQRCTGGVEFGEWGDCERGISPRPEVCDGLDNDCNGCADESGCVDEGLSCPGPGDPRIADGRPFEDYRLFGPDFFSGDATAWRWSIQGGPCESLLPAPSYETMGTDRDTFIFRPTFSGDYTVDMEATLPDGTTVGCTFVVHIRGPGLRVELCWGGPGAVGTDLDLYLHRPDDTSDWFAGDFDPLRSINDSSCNWANCAAELRGTFAEPPPGLVDWGYADSALAECENGPQGDEWRMLGACRNPRIDVDSHGGLFPDDGFLENINVDQPADGQSFRIMVQHYHGDVVTPMVNVYCGGRLRATLGAAPDVVPDFQRFDTVEAVSYDRPSAGTMWRAADVRVRVDAAGETTGCDVTPLRDPDTGTGYHVTWSDPSY